MKQEILAEVKSDIASLREKCSPEWYEIFTNNLAELIARGDRKGYRAAKDMLVAELEKPANTDTPNYNELFTSCIKPRLITALRKQSRPKNLSKNVWNQFCEAIASSEFNFDTRMAMYQDLTEYCQAVSSHPSRRERRRLLSSETIRESVIKPYEVTLYEEDVKESAKEKGFKTANLEKLKGILSDYTPQSDISVKVPKFYGVPSGVVLSVLEEYDEGCLQENWAGFLAEQSKWQERPDYDGISLSPEAQKYLKGLRALIREAFEDRAEEFTEIANLPKWAKELIKAALESNKKLIVRSTSNEDNEFVSNPGGNKSLPTNVDYASVLRSIGEVVESYFEEHSLLQQLRSGANILQPQPFMPCLIQTMMTEVVGEDAATEEAEYVSGVMFTQGAKQADASEVRVEFAYGNCSRVVDSTGSVSTADVAGDGTVFCEVREQKTRTVSSVKDGGASGHPVVEDVNTDNPFPSSITPLPEDVLREMANVARYIEQYYGMPMDIEFTYNPKTHELYVLQARKRIESSQYGKNATPSALDQETTTALTKEGKRLKAEVITENVRTAVAVTSVDEILVCETIVEALSLRKSMPNLKAVVVREPAGSTSHPSNEFTIEGIPVLRASSKAEYDAMRVKAKAITVSDALIVDPQRRSIFQVTGKKKVSEVAGVIAKGVFGSTKSENVYVSETADQTEREEALTTQAHRFFLENQQRYADLPSFSDVTNGPSSIITLLEDTIERLSLVESTPKKNAFIRKNIYQVLRYIDSATEKGLISPALSNKLKSTAGLLLENLAALETTGFKSPREQRALRTRYFDTLRKFEGLLLAKPKPGVISTSLYQQLYQKKQTEKHYTVPQATKEAIKGAITSGKYDAVRWPADIQSEDEKVDYLAEYYYLPLLRLEGRIVNEEGKFQWRNLCKKVLLRGGITKFGNMVKEIVNLGVGDFWVNAIVAEALVDTKSGNNYRYINAANSLMKDFSEGSEDTRELKKALVLVKEIESQIEGYAEPGKFQQQFEKLQATYRALYEGNPSLVADVQTDSPFNAYLRSTLTRKFIDAIDQCMKSLQTSSLYGSMSEEQVERFGMMLDVMLDMLGKNPLMSQPNTIDKARYFQRNYAELKNLHLAWKDDKRPYQLKMEGGFSPGPLNIQHADFLDYIGSMAHIHNEVHTELINFEIERLAPITEELHAGIPPEMEPLLSKLTSKPLLNSSFGENYGNERLRMDLVATEYNNPEVTLFLKAELRQHMGNVKLTFNRDTGTVAVEADMFGDNDEGVRWLYTVAALAKQNLMSAEGCNDFRVDSDPTGCHVKAEFDLAAIGNEDEISTIITQFFSNSYFIAHENRRLEEDMSRFQSETLLFRLLLSDGTDKFAVSKSQIDERFLSTEEKEQQRNKVRSWNLPSESNTSKEEFINRSTTLLFLIKEGVISQKRVRTAKIEDLAKFNNGAFAYLYYQHPFLRKTLDNFTSSEAWSFLTEDVVKSLSIFTNSKDITQHLKLLLKTYQKIGYEDLTDETKETLRAGGAHLTAQKIKERREEVISVLTRPSAIACFKEHQRWKQQPYAQRQPKQCPYPSLKELLSIPQQDEVVSGRLRIRKFPLASTILLTSPKALKLYSMHEKHAQSGQQQFFPSFRSLETVDLNMQNLLLSKSMMHYYDLAELYLNKDAEVNFPTFDVLKILSYDKAEALLSTTAQCNYRHYIEWKQQLNPSWTYNNKENPFANFKDLVALSPRKISDLTKEDVIEKCYTKYAEWDSTKGACPYPRFDQMKDLREDQVELLTSGDALACYEGRSICIEDGEQNPFPNFGELAGLKSSKLKLLASSNHIYLAHAQYQAEITQAGVTKKNPYPTYNELARLSEGKIKLLTSKEALEIYNLSAEWDLADGQSPYPSFDSLARLSEKNIRSKLSEKSIETYQRKAVSLLRDGEGVNYRLFVRELADRVVPIEPGCVGGRAPKDRKPFMKAFQSVLDEFEQESAILYKVEGFQQELYKTLHSEECLKKLKEYLEEKCNNPTEMIQEMNRRDTVGVRPDIMAILENYAYNALKQIIDGKSPTHQAADAELDTTGLGEDIGQIIEQLKELGVECSGTHTPPFKRCITKLISGHQHTV